MTESTNPQKAQLDKAEREHLEDVVKKLRSRVEDNVQFQLTQKELEDEPEKRDSLNGDRKKLVEAIDIEKTDDHTWKEAFEEYTAGVGYTIVNRLAALRCMEVRGFINEEVTVFKQNGLTPAAETLVREEFLLEDEAILTAYHNTCDEFADEIEILFDRSSAYSLVDPDDDTFEQVCGMLNEIPDEVWRADDVLGWIYEYYNRPIVEELDTKNTLEPEDVGPANQFYTPHWVVRMLADNSLGKLYLEATNQENNILQPEGSSPENRKNRVATPADSPTVPELCTYLIPDEEPDDAPEFNHPRELRVIDPACGSGHFLLYAFDILERIWWAETDLDRSEIPRKILRHNLYGVDIDLRSCQLSAFNLYLKARTRTEEEGGQFEMPNVGIVCADARVAEIEEADDALDKITGEGSDLREALDNVIEKFQQTEALGSLLDVGGTLREALDSSTMQAELSDYDGEAHQSLNSFLKALRQAVQDQTSDSFGEQNLRSFLHLLAVLTQEYDTALMNPPYGMRGRMPDGVKSYVEDHYDYYQEYYVNFFEVCERLSKTDGRVGMLVPWSFMFRKVFESFRVDFVDGNRTFDFLAEFGYDVLDNATVGTVGTVVRVGTSDGNTEGKFIRLHDVSKSEKERTYINSVFKNNDAGIKRVYTRDTSEFSLVPGASVSYWVPIELRRLYDSEVVLDSENGSLPEKTGVSDVKQGIISGDNTRFLRKFWEISEEKSSFPPLSDGGTDTWLLPRIEDRILWENNGREIKRYAGSRPQNIEFYFTEGISFNRRKRSGRHFGYMHPTSVFSESGTALFPEKCDSWALTSYLNSRLLTYLKLAQTFERKWEISTVARLPVPDVVFENEDELAANAHAQVAIVLARRSTEFTSVHFSGTLAAQMLGYGNPSPPGHPHRTLLNDIDWKTPPEMSPETSIEELAKSGEDHLKRLNRSLEQRARETDQLLFDRLKIEEDLQREVLQEVELRTIDDPLTEWKRKDNSEYLNTPSVSPTELVRDLLLQFSMDIVRESDDGIIPISGVDERKNLFDRIKMKFRFVWGEQADARLAEVDDILGSKSADKEAYPNIRTWLEQDLFEYHISEFDRTPIIWRLTTERLISDPQGEGFGCFVDYHQLNKGTFDRLSNQYLESRKAILRERRSAANRRRGDDSLSTSEQANAAEEFARCESGLKQISVFEDRVAELAQPESNQSLTDEQKIAKPAADRVAEFRKRTEDRLEIIDKLNTVDDAVMGDLFTENFYDKVQSQRDEWIDGLEDLEAAFEATAADSKQPMKPHQYDLFDYYQDDLLGSSHFASNGVLYMTYYFNKFEQADQIRLENASISQRQRLTSQLADGLDEYIQLGKSISTDCEMVSSKISANWSDRALSEIMIEGYQPNHKHGVRINISPLAQVEIVPKTVDDDVL